MEKPKKFDPSKDFIGEIIEDNTDDGVSDVSREPPKPDILPYRKLNEIDLNEGIVLTNLLKVLCDGVVKPNDVSYQVERLRAMNRGGDLDGLINCCPSESTIREAKDFKELIGRVIDRLIHTLDI